MMSLSDPSYSSSAANKAGLSGSAPECDCPGFDSAVLPSPDLLLGRWVRSPSKFVGWDTYMEFFGLTGDKALQETEEPQEHVIMSFSKEKLHILHRLPWRDGLDCEYIVPLDGSVQPIPPAMVARASSSWKVNDLMNWVHTWDDGDGNPLHRGLRTEQKLRIGETNYTLRYWRSLIAAREMRVNVEVTYSETGKYAVHTQRFFRKIDVEQVYAIASVPRQSLLDGIEAWTHGGRAVRIAMLPHASNMPHGWEDLEAAARWDAAEPFPSAGRSSGPFLSELRAEAVRTQLWVCCGVVLRASVEGQPHALYRAVALIGADGWLHAVHVDAAAPSPYVSGAGDWPATQRARPYGVYDTELGRIAVLSKSPDSETTSKLASMGAEVVLAPPESLAKPSRAALSLLTSQRHMNYTQYELCGPEALPCKRKQHHELTLVAADTAGSLQATCQHVMYDGSVA
jgi:hypothetical protein